MSDKKKDLKLLDVEGAGLATGGIVDGEAGVGLATAGMLEPESGVVPPVPPTPERPVGTYKEIVTVVGILRAWDGATWTNVTPRVFIDGSWAAPPAKMWTGLDWGVVR